MVIPAIRSSPRSELTTVASRTIDRGRTYAAEWTIPRVLGSYEALLDDPEIDVVYISLPNSLHVEWTVRALEAGKHVLCEKPLAQSVEDVDRVAAAATRASRMAAESSLGGGSLWDVGCYPVSYTNVLAGKAPVEVFGWQQVNASGIDVEFAGMMRFDDGAVAQFDSGFVGPFRAEMEAIGRNAALRIERPFRADAMSALRLTTGDRTEVLPFERDEPFAGEIADMEAAVLDSRPQRIPLSESRRTVQTICALYDSARRGVPVSIDGA